VRKPDALADRPNDLAFSLVRVVALDVPGYTPGRTDWAASAWTPLEPGGAGV
jgi:hypothetical protein